VLRLRRKRVRVRIGTDDVRVQSPAGVARRGVPATAAPGATATNGELVECLDALLADLGERVDVDIVLDNPLVRYATLPWSPDLNGADEWNAFAQVRMRQVYGEGEGDWRIKLSPGAYGEAGLACAMPESLLLGLQQMCARRGLRLRSLRPGLMGALAAAAVPRSTTAFVLADVDPHGCVLAMHDTLGWSAVRYIRQRGMDWPRMLDQAETFVLLAGAAEDTPIFVHGLPAAADANLGAHVTVVGAPAGGEERA
jgi:hypothetical protein